jgi:hypothetical protein
VRGQMCPSLHRLGRLLQRLEVDIAILTKYLKTEVTPEAAITAALEGLWQRAAGELEESDRTDRGAAGTGLT